MSLLQTTNLSVFPSLNSQSHCLISFHPLLLSALNTPPHKPFQSLPVLQVLSILSKLVFHPLFFLLIRVKTTVNPAMRIYPIVPSGFIAAVVLFLLFSYLASIPVVDGSSGSSTKLFKQKRILIGSRPPSCANKCFNCRPCAVTLVTPPHGRKSFTATTAREEEEGYYLLSWRCRCGSKLFDP